MGAVSPVIDNSVFVTDVTSGQSERWTDRTDDASAPLPLACVFSPDGRSVAVLRTLGATNQIFVASEPG
jgi:hypothetical protein